MAPEREGWRGAGRITALFSGRPGANLSRTRREKIVRQVLSELPERSRILLALRYYEGFGIDELAAAVRADRETVSRELALALRAVQSRLRSVEREGTGAQRGERQDDSGEARAA